MRLRFFIHRCAVIIVKLYELMVILTLSISQYQFFPCPVNVAVLIQNLISAILNNIGCIRFQVSF